MAVNIILNAIQNSKDKGSVKVFQSFDVIQNEIVFIVSDNGKGMSAQQINSLFNLCQVLPIEQ